MMADTMKLLRTTILMVLLAFAGGTWADEVKVANISMMPGQNKTISVELENTTTLTGIEFWMRLPEGVSIPKDEEGDYVVLLNSARLNKFELEVALDDDGRYHILSYSNSLKTIKGNSGELLSIELTCADDVAEGDYAATIENIICSDQNLDRVDLPNCTFFVHVGPETQLGDVNKDKAITIADVTALVNIILGKDNTVPYIYDHEAANVNKDEVITIADVTALVNIILGKN